MANLQETGVWEEGIYQLETSDPVMGGADGVDNKPLRQLANRTGYLKKKLEEYKPEAASTTKAGIVQLSSATNSDSEELAATPKAVKAAYDKAVEAAGKGLPVGAVVAFPRAITNPEGYLKADGSTFNQATYPDLYRALGTNKLPSQPDTALIGELIMWTLDGPLPDYLIEPAGQNISRRDYPELFAKWGTRYGAGDGSTTFGVPEARGEFPRFWDNGRGVDAGRTLLSQQIGSIGTADASTPQGTIGMYLLGNGITPAYKAAVAGLGLDALTAADLSKYKAGLVYAGAGGYGELPTGIVDPVPATAHTIGGVRPRNVAVRAAIVAKTPDKGMAYWIKAYGAVSNAGTLDASTLAAGLQGKSDKGHTHAAAEITDFDQAVINLFGADKSANGWGKLPNGLLMQWLLIDKPVYSISGIYSFPLAFPHGCLSVSINTCLDAPTAGNGSFSRVKVLSASQFQVIEDNWATNGRGWAAKTYVFAIGY